MDDAAHQGDSTVNEVAFRAERLTKDFPLKGETVRALHGVTFEVRSGEYIAVMGPSGSGKSTLLNLLGCLDRPTSGRYLLGRREVATLDDDQVSGIRACSIGFVFQSYNLIPQINVLENIQVPLQYQGSWGRDVDKKCRDLAEMVGLGDRLFHRPTELSGGQQQRVAIARSLANDRYFVLADEATGKALLEAAPVNFAGDPSHAVGVFAEDEESDTAEVVVTVFNKYQAAFRAGLAE